MCDGYSSINSQDGDNYLAELLKCYPPNTIDT